MFENQDSSQSKETIDLSVSTTLANPLSYVPKSMFFTKGKGIHKDQLTSFELALRNAQISDLNLVTVSSIKPPGCKIVSIQEGRKHLVPGQIVFAILARSSTNEPNRLIAASIGLAGPVDDASRHGYLSEYHTTGETAQKAGDYAEDMAMEMLATTLGLPDDPSLAWDQREEQWKLPARSTKRKTIHNRRKETKKVFGQRS